MEPEEIVSFTRAANEDLAAYLHDLPDEEIPAEWLHKWSLELARRLYQDGPHWHTVGGECVKVVTFEVQMQALALLSSWWVVDIFLRKARDRDAPRMNQAELMWEAQLLRGISAVQWAVNLNQDPEAVAAYQATTMGQGKRGFWWKARHAWNVWKWGH